MFDGFAVRDDFKKQNPELVLAFLKDYEQHRHQPSSRTRRKWSTR